MAELYRFAAFVSYSSKDAPFAKRLHRALESYGIPASLGAFDLIGGGKKNRVYPVFRDREELAAGELGERIEAALRASNALIVVCSPNSAVSPWVGKEIAFFAGLGRRERIFAIIADTAPLTDEKGGDGTPACFPPAFRGDALEGGAALEPLAADARKGKDGFRNAWLKLVAGLIGVTPGQIIDRDRRRRRASVIWNLALAGLALICIAVAYTQRGALEAAWSSATRYRPFVHASQALVTGATFQDCRAGSSGCPAMVVVPAGRFMMGSDLNETGAELDETPLHAVTISRFAVSKTEITFSQWAVCVAAGFCGGQPNPSDASWGRGERPVINVSWDDAHDYVEWLSKMTGEQYRLLSEGEWEYAARGQVDSGVRATRYSWGDAEPVCRRSEPNGAAFAGCGQQGTWPVGSFQASTFGLHDMHGNVWEWVQDCYEGPYRQSGELGPVAAEEESCEFRVLRGGAWDADAPELRSAHRIGYVPSDRGNDVVGFRVARTLE